MACVSDLQRFWSKVEQRNGCWIWTASCCVPPKLPYGLFWAKGKTRSAHKWIYEQLIGPVPAGLTLDHLCRTPSCVNPWHLEPVTIKVNGLRGNTLQAANAAKTHCIHGHEFTPENTYIGKNRTTTMRSCRKCHAGRERRRNQRLRRAKAV